MITTLVQKIALGSALFLSAQTLLAENSMTVCPSLDALNDFTYAASIPLSYDSATKSLQAFAIALLPAKNPRETLIMTMKSLPVTLGESPEDALPHVLGSLKLETPTPIIYPLINDLKVPLCIYTLPENPSFSAFVFPDHGKFLDDDDEDFALIKKLMVNS